MMGTKINRRDFFPLLAGAGAGLWSHHQLGGIPYAFAQSNAAYQQLQSRLIVIFLQGGLDGLSLLVPYGDPHYLKYRQDVAIASGSGHVRGIPIDPLFAFHPGVADSLWPYWENKQLLLFPTIASPYRGKDHAPARQAMQNGMADWQVNSGWLGRAISEQGAGAAPPLTPGKGDLEIEWRLEGGDSNLSGQSGLMPLEHRQLAMVANDPELQNALAGAMAFDEQRKNFGGYYHDQERANQLDVQMLPYLTENVAKTLLNSRVARVAAIMVGGFDTHIAQGGLEGDLSRKLAALSVAIDKAASTLRPVWNDSAILVVSEFGRSMQANNSNGTDHGLGGLAMLMGGRINGGKIVGNWPGIHVSHRKHGGLLPTVDSRSLFKDLIFNMWSYTQEQRDRIFPGHQQFQKLDPLFRPF